MPDFSHIASQALILAAMLAAPVILAAACVSFLISTLQAATQVQDQTVSAVPKLLAVAAALAIAGSWIFHELTIFAARTLAELARVG
ncbi:MAG: flagellar biosynthetic protein FliQ [Planctomycetes bacterium]|nr:flagellar biosynthetic protein FliQ [Planctomycetota bacterium]